MTQDDERTIRDIIARLHDFAGLNLGNSAIYDCCVSIIRDLEAHIANSRPKMSRLAEASAKFAVRWVRENVVAGRA